MYDGTGGRGIRRRGCKKPATQKRDYSFLKFPLLTWDSTQLVYVHEAADRSLVNGLRNLMRRPVHPVAWATGRAAQDAFYGPVAAAHHAFANDPLPWLRPSEPQITQGWAHFLTATGCTSDIRLARQQAFIRAAIGPDPSFTLPCEGEFVNVLPEFQGRHQGRDRSIDLVLDWLSRDGLYRAVAIEFKFDHHVTTNQLSDYYQIMKRFTKDMTRVRLVVVLADERSYPLEKRPSANWRVVGWRDLLRNIELLGPDSDGSYSRFRSVTWQRAGRSLAKVKSRRLT